MFLHNSMALPSFNTTVSQFCWLNSIVAFLHIDGLQKVWMTPFLHLESDLVTEGSATAPAISLVVGSHNSDRRL